MANSTGPANSVFLLFFAIIWVAQGSRTEVVDPYITRIPHASTSVRKLNSQGSSEQWGSRKLGRVMIGSTAPTCTYNECRGCKYKCRAEQVPVEGNDPINSPYHYKCVCHR